MKKKLLVLMTTLLLVLGLAGCGGTMVICDFCGENAKCKSMDTNINICKECLKKAENGEELYLGGY